MSDIALKVENLTKIYKLIKDKTPSLYNRLTSIFKLLLSNKKSSFSACETDSYSSNYITALDNVSFEVRKGEILGIIGKNGAGKTTLLKILAGITQPTDGEVTVKGKIGALLSLGVGFQPELSGRDNIYLNGITLGMKRKEIEKVFDDIVAFAELERFIDTPVKYYSSGMQLRLGFSIASFLNTDILLIDEVFGVGDIYFNEKALKKMEEIKKSGKTALFVSHQMTQVKRYCTKCLLLDKGKVIAEGDPITTVHKYEDQLSTSQPREQIDSQHCFLSWEIDGHDENNKHTIYCDEPFTVKVKVYIPDKIKHGLCGLALYNSKETLIFADRALFFSADRGLYYIYYSFPPLHLTPSTYTFSSSLYSDDNLVDLWYFTPPLTVKGPTLVNVSDEWVGILNIKAISKIERI
ncbi:MAG: polysaccharide ABC transporter ATP-binding protein [Planctomycetota bacterium]